MFFPCLFLFQEANENQLKKLEMCNYPSLVKFLNSIGESPHIISNGQGLPNGLLYDVTIHKIRKNIHIRNGELSKLGTEPKYVLNLSGRTDIVVLLPGKVNVTRMNIRYVIEVKVKCFELNMALKEAYQQLVGLNVRNNNTSPPVILTDFQEEHHVLCLERNDLVALKFKLCIHKSPSLVMCIQRCRALASRACFTIRFGSPRDGRRGLWIPPFSGPHLTTQQSVTRAGSR